MCWGSINGKNQWSGRFSEKDKIGKWGQIEDDTVIRRRRYTHRTYQAMKSTVVQ